MNVVVGSLKMETAEVLRPCHTSWGFPVNVMVFFFVPMFLTFSLRVIFLNPIKIELNSNKVVQCKLNTEYSSCRCKIRSRKCCTVNIASDSRELAPTIAFVQGIRFLNGYRRQMEVGLFIHYTGWMGSAGLGCLLYSCINVIYELANCLCPDRFHDQAGKGHFLSYFCRIHRGDSAKAERKFFSMILLQYNCLVYLSNYCC